MIKMTLLFGILMLLAFGLFGCSNNSSNDPNDVPAKIAQLNCGVTRNKITDSISVTNKDAFPYKNCVVHLNESGLMDEGYMSKSTSLNPGQTQNYDLSDFAKSDGTRFQTSESKVVQIVVETKNDGGFITGSALLTPTD